KRIFRYLKGKPHLGLWYPKDSPFDLVAYSDSDYVGASLDRKSTTGGCQFLGYRLISWQCKKQTIVATSSTKAEYVATTSGCAQVLWMQNQLLDMVPAVTFYCWVFNSPMLHVLRLEMVINSPWLLSKNWLVQKQTVFGKDSSNPFMADNFPKIVWYSTHHITCMKSWLVQKQTALGKDTSNPLIVDSLLKTIWFSIHHHLTIEVLAIPGQTATEKSDASEGFAQIIDFLSGSYIHYALTVSPHIYISCIKQFWNIVVVKRWGVVCLPNEEIFAGLAQMGYEKPSTKLTFYKVFFSSQWKFLIHTIIQSLRVETPLFENMLEVREVDAEEEVQVPDQDNVDQANVIEEIADDVAQPTSPLPPSPQVLDKCSALVHRIKGLETANTAQQLEIIKLKAKVKKLERLNKVKSTKLRHLKKVGTSQRIESSKDEENVFNQGRISVDIDEEIELVDDQEKDAQVKERQADTQAEIYNIDLDHTSKVVTAAATTAASIPIPAVKPAVVAVSTPISAAKPKVLKIADAPAVSTRKRKGVVIRDPEEELHDDTPAETLSVKDKGKGILVEDPKPMKKKDQIEMDVEYARKLQEEKESHVQAKDSREGMEKEKEEIIKSINETPVQKAAKRRRLQEEVQVPAHDDVDQENVTEEITDDVAQPTLPLPPSPILKLKARVKKLERFNKVKSSKLRRLKKVGTSHRIESLEDLENVFNQERVNVDIDEGIELVVDQEKDAEIEGRQADTQAKIYNIDLHHSSKVLSMQEDDAEVQEAVEIVTTAKLMTEVVTAATTQVVAVSTPISTAKSAAKPKVLKIVPAAPAVSTRKIKGVIIRDPEEELHDATPAETLSAKDKGKGILVKDPKPMKKKDQIEMDAEYARKLQEEEESHVQAKDVQAKDAPAKGIQFDANMRFLRKSKEEMEKEEEEIIKSINETPA
nr:uncharacterized mitochondrial protein AtMg00810-like [Tanacetum cinerariifolium]